jgi:outer membrane protein OmpA-like peptidoglycan-associated protein
MHSMTRRPITDTNMMMKTRYAVHAALILAAASVAAPLAAQPRETISPVERFRMGPMAAGTYNIHRGDFTTYDGVLECATFENTASPGWLAGYLLHVPLSGDFALSPRLHYWKADGAFTTPNPAPARVRIDENTVVPLETEHRLDVALDYASMELIGRWSFAGPFYVGAGPTIGLATRAAYEQEETILAPQGVTFTNGLSSRNIIAGNFDEQGTANTTRELRIAGTAVLGADLALGDRFVLSPEVAYSYGATNVLSSFPWKVHAIRAGASLTYAFGEPRRDTTILASSPAAPEPVLALDARGQLADGTMLPYAEIALVEERGIEHLPLLPYVFFAPNDATIPARYRQLSGEDVVSFSEDDLRDETLPLYHHVLNIVGSRMRRYPEATITITGCREPLDDAGSTEALSRGRAETVRQYLEQTWGIAPSRIRTAARVLPEQISNRGEDDGREENRRAEIASGDSRIVAPITRRLVTRTIEPAAIALVPTVQFGEAITSWRASLGSDELGEIWTTSGVGAPQESRWSVVESRLEGRDGTVRNGSLTARLEATTADGRTLASERPIPVRTTVRSRRLGGEIVSDSLVERFNLIFFDFDTPRISDFNRQVVGLIQRAITVGSSVTVTGLTDRIGEEAYNRQLAERRAASTAAQIRERIVPERMSASGAGETLIYDNDLPEGRMYNRTVVVEIATPLDRDIAAGDVVVGE